MKISNLRNLETALGNLGRLQAPYVAKKIELEEKIKKLEIQFRDTWKKTEEEMSALAASIIEYAKANPGLFADSATLMLHTGQVKRRHSTRMDIPDEKQTIRLLNEIGLTDCVRIKQEVDKRAVAKLSEADQHRIGVIKVEDVNFTLEPIL